MTDRPQFTHRRERRGLIGPFGGRQLLFAAAVVAAVAVVLVGVTTPLGTVGGGAPGNPQPTQYVITPGATGLKVGDVPPELTVTDSGGASTPLVGLDGQPIQLAALRGHPVWINFFASWCPPCQSETPVIRDVADRYRADGLVVVGVSVQESSVDNVQAYADRYQLDYPIGADVRGSIYDAYRLRGIPTSFFVGPEGAIHTIINGPLNEASAVGQVEALLPARASGSAPASPSPSASLLPSAP